MFNKTVDSITKVFTQAITDLTAVAEAKNKQINTNLEKVSALEAENATAKLEMSRAEAIRTKLEALVTQ